MLEKWEIGADGNFISIPLRDTLKNSIFFEKDEQGRLEGRKCVEKGKWMDGNGTFIDRYILYSLWSWTPQLLAN